MTAVGSFQNRFGMFWEKLLMVLINRDIILTVQLSDLGESDIKVIK